MAGWDTCTTHALPDPATEVFRLLGFADPEKINLNSHEYGAVRKDELVPSNETRPSHGNVHCYKKAIEDGRIKMASQSLLH
jgi:hypothetical protein